MLKDKTMGLSRTVSIYEYDEVSQLTRVYQGDGTTCQAASDCRTDELCYDVRSRATDADVSLCVRELIALPHPPPAAAASRLEKELRALDAFDAVILDDSARSAPCSEPVTSYSNTSRCAPRRSSRS